MRGGAFSVEEAKEHIGNIIKKHLEVKGKNVCSKGLKSHGISLLPVRIERVVRCCGALEEWHDQIQNTVQTKIRNMYHDKINEMDTELKNELKPLQEHRDSKIRKAQEEYEAAATPFIEEHKQYKNNLNAAMEDHINNVTQKLGQNLNLDIHRIMKAMKKN